MSSIYIGGSRHQNITQENHLSVLRAIIESGESVHVGCQSGVDQSVVSYFGLFAPSSLVVFAVAPNSAKAPRHIQQVPRAVRVVYSAGGTSAPIKARYLLRSITAFQGCESAVFFNPGPGSLAVAREAVRAGLRVFAFSDQAPAPVPSCHGLWCMAFFQSFQCWAWGKLPEPEPKQMKFI